MCLATKGPMVLDWGVASVCGSPDRCRLYPWKNGYSTNLMNWMASSVSNFAVQIWAWSIFINPGRVLCVFCCVHLLWTERIASKQFPAACYLIAMLQRIHWKALGWAICSEILLAYWSQQLADLDFQHAGEAQSQCRLWSVYRAYMHIVGRDLLWASFTYSKFVHHLK